MIVEMIQNALDLNFSKENWIAMAGNFPAWIALAISLISLVISRKSYHLSERKERRSLPDLSIYLEDAYTIKDEKGLNFFIKNVITNRSDTANTICGVEAIITFVQPNGYELRRRVRPSLSENDGNNLCVGLRFNPWEAKACMSSFHLEELASKLKRLPSVVLEISDSTGAVYNCKTEIVSERSV
ncbi:hypothetical protein [Sphingobium yanoikuyae]|uniref:hypothetical protein n=1 Tax=Sphingobium yanoikuyae TaxID=13690 RepID=UPI0022DE96CF|nr:hypothetical protein [Sphingobium yanoikuyae]WBQ14570.1 hypothetical protein PAE53_11510 [Sphingobium yanoikuyae]